MKKLASIAAVVVVIIGLAACDHGSKTDSTIEESVAVTPKTVDRAILIDAVWGEGEGIPQDAACLAGSEFVLDATQNPITIAKNSMSDPYFVTKAVVVSSLNIILSEAEGMKADACADGDLYYIVSASKDVPIDIDLSAEGCTDIENSVTDAGSSFPATGKVTVSFATEEISTTPDCAEGEVCVDTPMPEKMFKLVVAGCASNPVVVPQ